MALPNPFRRRTANTRTYWGYTFELTEDHPTQEQMNPMKHSYDKLADDCLAILDEKFPPIRSVLPRNSTNDAKIQAGENNPLAARDLYLLLRDNAESDDKLKQLWNEVNTVPSWVDWDQIERGQDVFYRYGGAALTGLAYQSLLGGMGAGRVVETLARTGGFSVKVARRRLFETTQHILQCTKSLESLKPGGAGFASSVRVRFLHAAVRQRILKLAKDRPEYYSIEKFGVPVNDLDSIATIGSFSSTLIWMSFPRQGIFLREQEIIDYIALWRYIAYLMGCPTDVFESPARAKAMNESLIMFEIEPTDTSILLANNVIKALDGQPPGYASASMLAASARWLNGRDLSDRLKLPQPSLYYWALMAGQCFFFMAFAYTYRSFPSLDEKKIKALKRIFYAIVVESKQGLGGNETLFDFKYVPEYSTITEMSDEQDANPQERGVERRNLKALVLGVGVIATASWIAYNITSTVFRWMWR